MTTHEALMAAVLAILDEYAPRDSEGSRHPRGYAEHGWAEVVPKWIELACAHYEAVEKPGEALARP